MKRHDSLRRIQHLMGVFVEDVKSSAAMGHTDVNRVAEDILVPLLRLVFKYPSLKNLNAEEKENFPGVDLGDYEKRVAIQVTSTSTSEKIKSSLEKFVAHGLDERFSHLRFYILTEKQGRYGGNDWSSIIDGKFVFNKEKDILDSSDMLKAINHLEDVEDIYRIENFLEDTFGKGTFSSFSSLSTKVAIEPSEEVFSNLLEIFFADDLYVANVQKPSPTPSKPRGRRNSKAPQKQPLKTANNDSRLVFDALKQQGEEYVRDWICHSGQLFTFRDLRQSNESLRSTIETESIEKIKTAEFFETGADEERAFKFLLDRCLSVRLEPKNILWKREERCYIFMPFEGETVRKESGRSVYKITKKKGEDAILNHRHMAFRVRYHRFGEMWFATVTPDWFFSYNGFDKSIYHSDLVAGKKDFERNDAVFRDIKVICKVLQSEIVENLFEPAVVYPYLRFGQMLSFSGGKVLDDKQWRPNDPKKTSDLELFSDDEEDDN